MLFNKAVTNQYHCHPMVNVKIPIKQFSAVKYVQSCNTMGSWEQFHFFLGHSNSKRILKLHDGFKSYGNIVVGFYLVVELAMGDGLLTTRLSPVVQKNQAIQQICTICMIQDCDSSGRTERHMSEIHDKPELCTVCPNRGAIDLLCQNIMGLVGTIYTSASESAQMLDLE